MKIGKPFLDYNVPSVLSNSNLSSKVWCLMVSPIIIGDQFFKRGGNEMVQPPAFLSSLAIFHQAGPDAHESQSLNILANPILVEIVGDRT